MSDQFKKALVRTQVITLVVALAAYFFLRWPPVRVVTLVLVMEVFGVLGAWWGARLRRKIEAMPDAPLKPRDR